MTGVKIWTEKINIPTYGVGEADKNPLFFEKRVYQGSSGKVYPLPVTEKISDQKKDQTYEVVYLENDYLKIMVLPALGGRIQSALDKTNDYHFVYQNDVIKPALVGLLGPWISGGIEFNWPQHHRPSTYMPVEYQIVENDDGSKTLKVSEIDQMYGTKGMASYTLYPDKAYIKIDGQLFNRTDTPQTFLWWANPAVPVNDYTYSVFPPDVNAVMDHGKRAVSTFPIATGEYYKYDYSEGIDIAQYKNIPVPTSYMAAHSDYDFIGNYDAQKEAGLLHVADHHISPGKKQWTWGNADFGQAWDRNLTDHNGPYIELMTGVYADNQPDFTWLKPYEEKNFTQYFMPYKGVGHIKNATIDAAINATIEKQILKIKLYVTAPQENLTVVATHQGRSVYMKQLSLDPTASFEDCVAVQFDQIDQDFEIKVTDQSNHSLVTYRGYADEITDIPDPEPVLPAPEAIKTVEELFLAAEHLEQYRHATYDATDYYLEGLKRSNNDIRLNNGYGLNLYRRGLFTQSEQYFRQALKTITWKTQNPYSGEPSYNLGLSLLRQNRLAESFDHFYKATWNEETKDKAYFELAKIKTRQGQLPDAIDFLVQAIDTNQANMKARHMLATLLRLSGQDNQAVLEEGLARDPLDAGLNYEQNQQSPEKSWLSVMGTQISNFLELSIDYLDFHLVLEAEAVLTQCPDQNPIIDYFKAYCQLAMGNKTKAVQLIQLAEQQQAVYCFPNRPTEQQVLEQLIQQFPDETAYAQYALGNLYYDHRRYQEARDIWERAAKQLPNFATVKRNLAFAYYNHFNDAARARELMIAAFDCNRQDGRVLLELDYLAEKLGESIESRRQRLEANMTVVEQRDALLINEIHLLNIMGHHQAALDLIEGHQFHPWEGGEGKISGEYQYALVELGKAALKAQQFTQAIKLLEKAKHYPDNLGEGRLPNVTDSQLDYFIGLAYETAGQPTQAKAAYQRATIGNIEPTSVLYYNDQPADDLLYQGLAYQKLSDSHAAQKAFNRLKSYGMKHINDDVQYDYFAVSKPETIAFEDDIQYNNAEYCRYLMALGEIGLDELVAAKQHLEQILAHNPAHAAALRHLQMIEDWCK